jgi:hypothetical protein
MKQITILSAALTFVPLVFRAEPTDACLKHPASSYHGIRSVAQQRKLVAGGGVWRLFLPKCGHEWSHLTPKPERMGSRNLWQFQSANRARDSAAGSCQGSVGRCAALSSSPGAQIQNKGKVEK